MKHFNLNFCVYLLVFFFFLTNLSAQNQQVWSKTSKKKAVLEKKLARKSEPSKSIHYQLDLDGLKRVLGNASKSKDTKNNSSTIIEIPNSDGGFDAFSVTESSILEPDFQKKHPEIRTYIGQNVKDPSSTISFSITPQGFHAMTLSSKNGTEFIDPYTHNNEYVVYNRKDLPALKNEFECLVPDSPTLANKLDESSKVQINPNDSKLRTFRLAIASTIEYSEFHWKAAGLTAGSSEASKKAAVLAAMVVTMNRVNTIFQRDLAIKMILVNNNTNIIFINSDNFSNTDANLLIDESQSVINSAIGSTNYDIGHTFSTGAGGLATLNSPCVTNSKARGITGSGSPVGDPYDIEYVAHEMGHQFGAPHTFNGNASNCGGTNRSATNAYEPGSGSTIMAYAGICSPQNVQSNGDAYFHQKSIQMIWANITTGNSTCAQQTVLPNKPPVANAGADYTIPISTPFKLMGSSTDPDGTSTHTYTWEQFDLGPAGMPLETNISGPMVRSYEGTTNPVRNIPKLSDYIAAGGSTTWEKLPSVNRTMTFALTVRDNQFNGTNGAGQTAVDDMTVTTSGTTPFSVVNPTSWAQGSTQNIQWVVGQTANAGTINCQSVNIKLSVDGGLTFPLTIVSGTPNDGSYSYTVPALTNTNQARLLIEAADNIFYDVSDFNFNVSSDQDFLISNVILSPISCGQTTATYTFDYTTTNGFSQTTTFSASNLPGGATAIFSPTSRNASGNVTMTVNNLDGVPPNNYNIIISGTAQIITKDTNVNFPFFNSICTSSGTLEFQTSTTSVVFNTINQTSGKSSYSDYTSNVTNVTKNNTYSLSVRVNTDGPYYTHTKAWIDWNQNCSFNDPGEEYNLGHALNVTNGTTLNSPLSIVVPNTAASGNTIMRVSTKYADDIGIDLPTACETDFDGEVEDYTINVEPTFNIEKFDFNNLIVYPNPNKGEFTIKLNTSNSRDIKTEVYDIRGRSVYKNTHPSSNNFEAQIHVEGLESGIYLLIVNDGIKRHTQKIAVN